MAWRSFFSSSSFWRRQPRFWFRSSSKGSTSFDSSESTTLVVLPALVAGVWSTTLWVQHRRSVNASTDPWGGAHHQTTSCDEGSPNTPWSKVIVDTLESITHPQQQPPPSPVLHDPSQPDTTEVPPRTEAGMWPQAVGDYYGLFPARQLWHPALEYPLWDDHWDGRAPWATGDASADRRAARHLRKRGVTRHLLLIRHGQYDETHKEDDRRKLTALGKEQAELTGQRLAEMLQGAEKELGPCRITALRVSGLTRARETAHILAKYLPGVPVMDPDPLLNEGRPCHHIPGPPVNSKIIQTTDENHPRIEMAFQKYFYRAPVPEPDPETVEGDQKDNTMATTKATASDQHEFEIIVCHANVIRYFLCRALQLPPETWLRYCPFNCSITYLTIRPTGSVSCRMMGDIGHLPYRASTFSGHHGYNW